MFMNITGIQSSHVIKFSHLQEEYSMMKSVL